MAEDPKRRIDPDATERARRDGRSLERADQDRMLERAGDEESFIEMLLRTLRLSRRPRAGDPKPGRSLDDRPR